MVAQPSLPNGYPNAGGSIESIMLGERHYIRTESNKEMLFDTSADPAEQHDLSRDADQALFLLTARQALASARESETEQARPEVQALGIQPPDANRRGDDRRPKPR